MNRLFYTTGKNDIIEEEWKKPEHKENEVEVKSILTGVCRSDIDMYHGTFQTLPKTIQGHESVGVVTKVGKRIRGIKEGDYVATRGEPAFADYYNCPHHMFVKIPSPEPKYILEPIACGINIAKALITDSTYDNVLLLGSGFLATIVYTTLNKYSFNNIVVVGNANKEFWESKNNVTLTTAENVRGRKFNYVIDLSDKPEYLDLNVYAEGAIIVLAAEKHPAANTTFGQFLWNAVSVKFPSPRNESFFECMSMAEELVRLDVIKSNLLWTKEYKRDTEVKLAFEEGLYRPPGYSRGYIKW